MLSSTTGASTSVGFSRIRFPVQPYLYILRSQSKLTGTLVAIVASIKGIHLTLHFAQGEPQMIGKRFLHNISEILAQLAYSNVRSNWNWDTIVVIDSQLSRQPWCTCNTMWQWSSTIIEAKNKSHLVTYASTLLLLPATMSPGQHFLLLTLTNSKPSSHQMSPNSLYLLAPWVAIFIKDVFPPW